MSTDDFHFFLIRKEPGDRQVPWQDRKSAISSDSKDENFSHEGVADVEAADAEFAALVAAVCAAFLYTSAFDSDTAAAEREAEALAAAEIASLE